MSADATESTGTTGTAGPDQWGFDTLQVHAGQQPDPSTGARALPIFQTTAYVFPDADSAAGRFALTEPGHIYTRLNNPTQDAVEGRVAALEGGTAALLLASGQSATTYAILNVADSGDHIVASRSLYGGTFNLLKVTLGRLGIETTFVDPDDPAAWRDAVRENTKLFFGESIPNPKGDVFDIESVAEVAREAGVPLVIDNTVATPYLLRPFDHGANVVVHSATKFLGGHGTALAGVVVENGSFDFGSGRFPGFSEPDDSYHGVVFAGLGGAAFTARIRTVLLRDIGAAVAPFNAFLIAQGLETLSLRMQRHVDNAQHVAEHLEANAEVTAVTYPGLASSPYKARAEKYLPKGAGSVLTFELAGGREAGIAFVDALRLHSNVANIGDVRSLVIHPASTTHSQMTDEELAGSGISAGTVRLSVGIEDVSDIISDIDLGLAAASRVAKD